ncbi:hypothetical protein K493DRAFT_332901 [Basidiobolus meristosporus CBS 931.73]|uniref:Protein kinase domain-containing protein n=1 Tax=Basidiobolus meristosporus CBS 931.73 TaxID=1314790 RepID=A0A1Y1Z9I4_9FUNG|nr:hypothetical protein K493DRAFT_332901 [Basidiobolus meristosporus CBS 931.73]|eukprot:ORY06938.1 hypothetical protein K493DRAFT_332901 [Basidiobolus meristosporus CBS 931.73]
MWSLGCILCETWMGHTLFASITRSDMMNEMSRLLGKFPKEIYKNGKYCDDKFLKPTQDDADIKLHIAQSIANLLKTTDVNFLDFISSLLLYDPSKRLTPGMAIQHPFIADMVHLDSFSDKLYPFLLPVNDAQCNPAGAHEQRNRQPSGGLAVGAIDRKQKRMNQDQSEGQEQTPSKKRLLNRNQK